MTQRRHASTAILAALAVAWLLPAPAAAQDWSGPRTPWGEPDLQGVWDFRTVTPMERPDEFEGQEFLTEEEAAALEQQAVENQVDRPPREGDPGTYNQFWMDFGTNIIGTRRTSLIVDPPDGKIPDLAPPAKRRQEELAAAREGVGDDVPRPGHWVEDVPVSVRCIVGFNSGPPMYPAAYNNNVQIFQAPGYVALYNEMGPASRIVPLDGRDHLPEHLRQWLGDSRGRWEGDTLVVETKNFLRETAFGRYAGAVVRLGGSGSEYPPGRAVHARGRRHAAVRSDRGRRHDVGAAVDVRRPDAVERPAGVRVRLPRGKLRPREHPGRRADRGGGSGQVGRGSPSRHRNGSRSSALSPAPQPALQMAAGCGPVPAAYARSSARAPASSAGRP